MQSKTNKLITKVLTLSALLSGAMQGYSQPPTAPAAAPTLPQSQAIAVYNSSGAYVNIPVPYGYFEEWWNAGGTSGLYNIVTAGPATNTVLAYYAPVGIYGIDFSPNLTDVSGCTNIHVDVYSTNTTAFGIRLVSDNSPNHQDADVYVSITPRVWTGVNIPLSNFLANNPALTLTNVMQIGILGNGGGDNTYFIDNLYFASSTNLNLPPPRPTNNAAIPTRAQSSVWAQYNSSGTYTNAYDISFYAWGSATSVGNYTIPGTVNAVLSYIGLAYYGVEMYPSYDGGSGINASASDTFHADVWTPGTNYQIGVKLVSTDTGANPTVYYPATGVLPNHQWVSVNIPLSAFTNLAPTLDIAHLDEMLWYGNYGNFYIDNVYFYKSSVATAPTITASVIRGTNNLTFQTQNGFNYTIQYKTNLTDGAWQTLSAVSGNNSTQTVTDPAQQKSRFYRLSIQ